MLDPDGKVSSTMKSASVWVLMAAGYVTPNFLILTDHLKHHLAVSGQCMVFLKGREVTTST